MPLPTWPTELLPQHCTVPSPSSAHVWVPPAVTATAPVMPVTGTGTLDAVVVPIGAVAELAAAEAAAARFKERFGIEPVVAFAPREVGGLVAIGIALSAMLFLFDEYVEVPANSALQAWKDAGYKPDSEIKVSENSWIAEANTIIRVGNVMRGGSLLKDISVFKQGEHADITEIVGIQLAVWENDHWVMADDIVTPAFTQTSHEAKRPSVP